MLTLGNIGGGPGLRGPSGLDSDCADSSMALASTRHPHNAQGRESKVSAILAAPAVG